MFRPTKPRLAGLKKGTREFIDQYSAWRDHRNRYPDDEWADPVRAMNSTVPHEHDKPVDDRPEYLDMTQPYTLAVDTETTGHNWFDDDRPFLGTISDHDRDYVFDFSKPDDVHEFHEAIDGAQRLVFHNAKYDIHHLHAAGLVSIETMLSKEVVDTETLARIVVPHTEVENYKLKTLSTIFVSSDAKDYEKQVRECMVSLGLIKKWDQQRVPDGAFYEVWRAYPDILEAYAMNDTRITYDLWFVLEPLLLEQNLQPVFDMERRLMTRLVPMESRGVRLDRARVDALHAKYEEEHASNLARLQELNGGEPMAPSNDTQVRALMELNGVELTETTPSGDIAVNKRSLTRAASLVPGASDIVDVIFEARSTEKLLSTYIEAMKDRDRVHADFQQIGARTGRMSCRRPNMQNLPVRGGPEMRSMFIPDPGMSLIVADYSSIELRLLAFYMNDQRLWDIIEAGDPFAWLGEQVYGTPDQTQWKVARQQLKNGFYALTYGAGGPKLAETIGGGMTDAEGRALARKIRSVLGVNYRALNKAIEHKIKTQGYVTTLLGRRQYVPRDRTYVGLNALIQGTAAEIMKRAMLRAHDSVNGDMLLTVHDELMMQVKTAYAEQELATLCDVMKSAEDVATNGKLRLAVDGKVCHNSYAEAK